MTKFTKERLEEIAELARKATYKPCAMHMTNLLAVCDSEVIEEMARQLLASMEQEPVAYMHHSGQVVTREECCDDEIFAICCKVETPLYAAPQLPQPAVPDMAAVGEMPFLGTQEKAFVSGWNACRAAMLQGAEPASNCDELPLDYLQGHKDGLEWAAQLAEANHPQTGDWLCDDPIELARAIRKGPDMPEGDSNSPVTPDGSEDTKRLDWLDAQNKRLNEYYGTSYGWKFDANFQRNAMMLNDSNYPVMTVRQAIDEAIAEAPKQENI